jgi:large subunit ribosomal protein L23
MIQDHVIKKAIITEKSLILAKKGIFAFEVEIGSRKGEIKKQIEKIFKVHVEKINTIKIKGKTKRVGKRRLKKACMDTKKAFIKLRTGEKIDLFETGESK